MSERCADYPRDRGCSAGGGLILDQDCLDQVRAGGRQRGVELVGELSGGVGASGRYAETSCDAGEVDVGPPEVEQCRRRGAGAPTPTRSNSARRMA